MKYIDLESESVSDSILSDVNLGGLIYLIKKRSRMKYMNLWWHFSYPSVHYMELELLLKGVLWIWKSNCTNKFTYVEWELVATKTKVVSTNNNNIPNI